MDGDDDNGLAYKIIHQAEDRGISFLQDYQFNSLLSYEFNSESFSFMDRLRYIEFDRDWSYDPSDFNRNFTENILNAELGLTKNSLNEFSYKLVRRKRGEGVDGFQHHYEFAKSLGPFQLRSSGYFMNNEQPVLNSEWSRFNADLSYQGLWFIPGYRFRQDRNEVVNSTTSEVVRSAMNFEEHTFYLKNRDTLNTTYGIEFQSREDRLPMNGELIDNNSSQTYNAFFKTNIDNTNQLHIRLTYRNLVNLNELGEDRNEDTILGRVDWVGSFFDNIILTDLNYDLSNSRELRREFVFIQVPTGQGTHTWRDDNGDGVQDLNEFYIAINPDEKNYAKIFVPTDTFEEAFNTIITYKLNVNFPREWNQQIGLKKTLSKFSNTTAWGLNAKVTEEALGARLLPTNVADDQVLGFRENLRSTLFFNRTNTVFGADVGISRLENKQLLTNGFEERINQDFRYHIRWNLNKTFNFDLNYIDGLRVSASDVLTQRNFRIITENLNPSLTFQPSRNLRITGSLAMKSKRNSFADTSFENAQLTEIGLGARLSKAIKTSVTANFKLVDIEFEGVETSPVGYELLEALRPGRNLTWNLNWQQKLGSGLQLLLRYDGRKSEGNQTIHLGRVQVTALF